MRLLRENTAFVKYKFNHAIKYTHNVFESKQKNSILNSDTLYARIVTSLERSVWYYTSIPMRQLEINLAIKSGTHFTTNQCVML